MPSLARRSTGAVLVILALVFALHSPVSAAKKPQVPKLSRQQLIALVDKYAAKYGIPRYMAHNLVKVESGWRQNAVSYRGARGIMQLMRRTARELRVNRNDPRQNIEGGMRYLRMCYNRFGRWDLALAAYHSGPRNVIRYKGVPPVSRKYVQRILRKPASVAAAELPVAAGSSSVATDTTSPVGATAASSVTATNSAAAAFARREHVTVSGNTTTTVRESLRGGQVVWRAEEIVAVEDGLRTLTTREYRLIDGVLTLVKEQKVVLGAVDTGEDNQMNEEK